MGSDIKKVFWVIVALVIVIVMGTNIVTPTANKIKAQKAQIDSMTYTAP